MRRPGEPIIPEEAQDLPTRVAAYERTLIRNALRTTGGQQRRAAALLGMPPTTLHVKIKALQIGPTGEAGTARSPELTSAAMSWSGRIPAGRVLELRGPGGRLTIDAGTGREVEIQAVPGIEAAAAGARVVIDAAPCGQGLSVLVRLEIPPGAASIVSPVDIHVRAPSDVRVVARFDRRAPRDLAPE